MKLLDAILMLALSYKTLTGHRLNWLRQIRAYYDQNVFRSNLLTAKSAVPMV